MSDDAKKHYINGFISYITSRDGLSDIVVGRSKSDTTSAKNDENSEECNDAECNDASSNKGEEIYSTNYRNRIRFATRQSKC